MRIGIVGGGSIGLLLAVELKKAGDSIHLLTRTDSQANAIQHKGITKQEDGQSETIKIDSCSTFDQFASTVDLWIFTTKSYSLKSLFDSYSNLFQDTPLLFIQNGMQHFLTYRFHFKQPTFFASVEHGATRIDDTTVIHNGIGPIKIGTDSKTCNIQTYITQRSTAFFPIEVVENIELVLLRKTIINTCINPLTVLLEVPNGQLVKNSYAHHLLRTIATELLEAFPEMHDQLSVSTIESICDKTSQNISSMLQDWNHHRPVELDEIVGSLIDFAKSKGKSLPYTVFLYELVLAKMNERK